MGIHKKNCWVVECDICGDELENGEGGTLCFFNKEEADKTIPLGEWIRKNGKLACPGCHEEL